MTNCTYGTEFLELRAHLSATLLAIFRCLPNRFEFLTILFPDHRIPGNPPSTWFREQYRALIPMQGAESDAVDGGFRLVSSGVRSGIESEAVYVSGFGCVFCFLEKKNRKETQCDGFRARSSIASAHRTTI